MKIKNEIKVGGQLDWLEVRGKDGKLKQRIGAAPNLLLNTALVDGSNFRMNTSTAGTAYLKTANIEAWDDIAGTWSQTGNTVTRATGAGVFSTSPTDVGNELRWSDGDRCHITVVGSTTSATVSGPARTKTGLTLRRFSTNGNGTSSASPYQQSAAGTITSAFAENLTTGIGTGTYAYAFSSAATAYSLGSIVISTGAYIKLPAPVAIDVDDQVTFSYTRTLTVANRTRAYELGAESSGLPVKFSMLTIVGNGTSVDVTFSGATDFLAGDKLDLRGIIPKQFAISSASSTSVTLTINTAVAHGLSPGDSVVIAGASLGGYNGTFTAATASGTVVTITDAANPGAMGASGTIRLATPGTYFNGISGGLPTIASMVSSSVARITSAVTGPAVNPQLVNGDPGISVINYGVLNQNNHIAGSAVVLTEANAKPIAVETLTGNQSTTGSSWGFDILVKTADGGYANDFQGIYTFTKNAGAGTGATRIKQIMSQFNNCIQINFNTPFSKTTAQRLTFVLYEKWSRDLP